MTKSKKLIVGGLIGMLGIVGATTATSGVAWFTTTRTAAVTMDNFIATAAEGNLQIANGTAVNEQGITHTVNTSANTSSVVASSKLTDVSSVNGSTFFKTTTVNGVSTTKQETTQINSINNTLYNYYQWDIQVTNTSTTAPMDVYISKNGDIFTDVVAESPTNVNPEKWYRMVATVDGTVVFAYGQESTATNWNAGVSSATDGVATTSTFNHMTTLSEYNADPEISSVSDQNQLLIKDLLGSPKTIIFTVWCEGLLTPPDGTDLEVEGSFNLVGFNHANS